VVSQQLLFSKEVRDDPVGEAPTQKVQLCDSSRQTLELDTLRSTKWVEELLRVPIQTRLVGDVNSEHLTVWCSVGHLLRLGIIGHKPLKLSK